MPRLVPILALLTAATAADGATVSAGSASVDRDAGIVSVDFSIRHNAEPGFAELLSNIAMHVVAADGAGNVLPVVPFGDEWDGGIFDQPNVTTHANPTEAGVLFVADFIGEPWHVLVGQEPLPDTTIIRPQLPKHLATLNFLVDADTPLGTYTVTPAWDGQLSAVATSGPQPMHGTVWYAVPMFFESGQIVVHTPEPAGWVMILLLGAGAFLTRGKHDRRRTTGQD